MSLLSNNMKRCYIVISSLLLILVVVGSTGLLLYTGSPYYRWRKILIPGNASNASISVEDDGFHFHIEVDMDMTSRDGIEFANELVRDWPSLMNWQAHDYDAAELDRHLQIDHTSMSREGGVPLPPRSSRFYDEVKSIKDGIYVGVDAAFHPSIWIDIEKNRLYIYSSD